MKRKAWDRAIEASHEARRERIEHIMARVNKENPESIADIARSLGVSRQRVSQIVTRERERAKRAEEAAKKSRGKKT